MTSILLDRNIVGEIMLFDIVILPPDKLRQKLGAKMKRALQGVPHFLVIDNDKLIPHLSLFHLKIAKKRVPDLFSTVERIAKRHSPMPIQSTGTKFSPTGSGFVFHTLSKPEILVKLHKEVIKKCHQLRTDAVPWNLKTLITGRKKIYRQKYGSHHILKNFHPHLTMARLKKPDDAAQVLKKMKMNFKFTAGEIYVCEVNNWLQVFKVLKRFKLDAKS